jgi:hypothetical protein
MNEETKYNRIYVGRMPKQAALYSGLRQISYFSGFSVTFDIEQDEYLGEITAKAGLRVIIHPQSTHAFPAENGIDVTPGEATSIAIRKVECDDTLVSRNNNCRTWGDLCGVFISQFYGSFLSSPQSPSPEILNG